MRRAAAQFICVCIVSLSVGAVARGAQFAGGTGTADDPYQIATAEQLISIGSDPNLLDKHYILTADIDLDPNLPGGRVFDEAIIAPDTDTTTEGFQGTAFTGVLDGDGHTIKHLTIRGTDYLGLFGRLGSVAVVSSLGLEAVGLGGTGDSVGALASDNRGCIVASYSTGAVAGRYRVGGLVGDNTGCIVAGHSTAAVTGDSAVAGLVGANNGQIMASYAASGLITGKGGAGGLVAASYGSYAHVVMCYSAGTVAGRTGQPGGLVASNDGTTTSSFWDVETSQQSDSYGGMGLTTAEMQDVNTYLAAGWDFAGEVDNGMCDYWQMEAGEYPRLHYGVGVVPTMPEGLGTAEQPYLIRDAWDLATVWAHPRAHYRLEASVDLSGTMWPVAVVPWFGGTFDGNGHTVSHVTIQGGSYVGLFGWLAPGAEVKNLTLADVIVIGSSWYTGGLAGRVEQCAVSQCHSTGVVSGRTCYVGGLLGCTSGGTVSHSHSAGAVGGGSYVGGLVGSNSSAVTECYSACGVTGGSYVGGLLGSAGGTGSVIECYSAGTTNGERCVGGLVGCNWSTVTQCYSTGAASATGENLGGLAGGNGGTVTECHSDVLVATKGDEARFSGGLVGANNGSVTQSYSEGETRGNTQVGGLVGSNSYKGIITASYSTGVVTGDYAVGGLAGQQDDGGSIATSHASGVVTGYSSVGGLVGRQYGGCTITASYATGPAKAGHDIGGLVGVNYYGSVTASYSAGRAMGGYNVGGLVGSSYGVDGIGESYSTGVVSGNSSTGGLVGYSSEDSVTTACLWDIQTSGQTSSAGGTGKTTAEMQTASTFIDAGRDFVDETPNGTEDIWWIDEGKDYPRLWWEIGDEALP